VTFLQENKNRFDILVYVCPLYTSDAADEATIV